MRRARGGRGHFRDLSTWGQQARPDGEAEEGASLLLVVGDGQESQLKN